MMMELIKSFDIGIEEIKLDLNSVMINMGYGENSISEEIQNIVAELYLEAKNYVDLRCGYVILEDVNTIVKGGQIILNDVVLNTERIISVPLKKMKKVVLFVATIGPRFDVWSKSTFESGDVFSGYVIDLIGSELAESLADYVEKLIVDESKLKNMNCSNRYSPGYCGWSVSDQHKLFSFLPKGFCGISLTESSLMKPHKSVSGIIGIGESIKRMEYPCQVCKASHCYKNKSGKK